MAKPIGITDPERPLTLLNFPFHSMIFVMSIIVLYLRMLISSCTHYRSVSKICLSIIITITSVLIGKICSKSEKQDQLFLEILTDFSSKLELIATVKNVTYYIIRCFKVFLTVFQKMERKFQKTWKFSLIGKKVRNVKILTATRKCSNFSRAPQSHKYACAEGKRRLLPVWTKSLFLQLFFVNLRDIRARTKRTNLPKEGKNYASLVNPAIFSQNAEFLPHFCISIQKLGFSQNVSIDHYKSSGHKMCQIPITIK